MDAKEFDNSVKDQMAHCLEVIQAKNEEYAQNDSDRLHAFTQAAELQGVTPVQAVAGMMAKHTVSVYKLAENNCSDTDMWREKLTDHINYLLILGALTERAENGC